MSIYKKLAKTAGKFFGMPFLMKWGFNLSPMYRRSTAKIIYVSTDMLTIKVRLPISYRNKNYMGSIFGGSMFAAADPIPMMQLVSLLGEDYVIWDKSAQVFFKRPAYNDLYTEFNCTQEEIEQIIEKVKKHHEIEIVKKSLLTNADKSVIHCEIMKTTYIADKKFYNERKNRNKIL